MLKYAHITHNDMVLVESGSPGARSFLLSEPRGGGETMASEPRIGVETGLARRVGVIAEPVLEDMGYDLVRVRVTGERGCTVQIMAERPDGTMTIDDCTRVSQALSALLDVEDPVEGEYNLEISSPGIDRPLVRRRDFARWAGYEAKIELGEPRDGRKRFRGVIAGLDGDAVRLNMQDAQGAGQEVSLPLDLVAEARLVLSDALVGASLKAQKKAVRQGRRQ